MKNAILKAGFSGLGINTYDKLLKLYRLIEACQTEKENFGLTIKEKESLLQLVIEEINLNEKQKKKLKDKGIKMYNASEWKVTENQKETLLDFGLNELNLNETQKEQLTVIHPDQFKTFTLTNEQKNILQSLAPLIREDKYSLENLELLKSLHLKPNATTFLVQEEIIPDPHTSFGTTKSSYLPLKEKFLKGEQKTLLAKKAIQEQALKEEEIRDRKLSILRNLMNYAQELETQCSLYEKEKNLNINLTLAEWIKEKALTNWQVDILLTCGFKTIPKYNFFELLIFCVEKFANQNWTDFLAANEDLAQGFEEYLESLRSQPITINQTIWDKFASSQSKNQREVIQQLNLKELIEEQINQKLGNWKPTKEENWLDIDINFELYLVQEWKSKGFAYETTKEWINIGLTINDAEFAQWLRDIAKLSPEEVLNSSSEELRNQFAEYKNSKPEPEKPAKSSRRDNLFANLSKEDAEKQRKKLEYEEAQKKFKEIERKRREEKLSEKDRKLKEDEERRKKERELAEIEEKKRQEAQEARTKEAQEKQENYLQRKLG